MSARPRPIRRLTETMVLAGSLDRLVEGALADLGPAVGEIANRRGQDRPPFGVGQALGDAVAHRGDQRMGGAEVDADDMAALVRIGRRAGLGDLQQGHGQASSAASRSSTSAAKRSTNISARTCRAAASKSPASSIERASSA